MKNDNVENFYAWQPSSREGPDVEEYYRLGANAYVVKPVDFNQFADAVKTIGKFWAVLYELPRVQGRSALESNQV